MPPFSAGQKKTVKRVMREYKRGDLQSGGRKKVTNRKQAIAIGLSEAGASKHQSPEEKRRSLARTKAKESGTALQTARRASRTTSARSKPREETSGPGARKTSGPASHASTRGTSTKTKSKTAASRKPSRSTNSVSRKREK
ncbi:MAG: DUF6496 domain-containing protein [Alphaproteobacteria bacterium]|nr:DUF6496 domain-containing protein [Alphaproteobacteria bacterium]